MKGGTRKFTPAQERAIAADYKAGTAIVLLVEKYGPVSTATIIEVLVRHGVHQRKAVRRAAAADLPDFKAA